MLTIVRKRVEKKGHKPPQTIVVTATVTADLSDAINTHFPVRMIALIIIPIIYLLTYL
jgi:hypothetical protein